MSENSGSGGWVFWLVGAGVVTWIYWAGGINQVWYSLQYSVGADKVHVDAKPKDCDFMHAPIGDKGCSYKASVTAYNATGELVGGDDAPKYGHDTKTGKPIISRDNGKTWDWYSGADVPNSKVDSVIVTWLKVTD